MRERVLPFLEDLRTEVAPHPFWRTLTCIYLFDFLDRLRAIGFPDDWFDRLRVEVDRLLESQRSIAHVLEPPADGWEPASAGAAFSDVKTRTGRVYSDLWKDFTKEEYFEQALAYLAERFEKNGIRTDRFADWNALDAGCGGGRYTLALKALGFRSVTGVDVSPEAIEMARRMNPYTDAEATFLQGSVLELPLEDASFDFVFSNGVLHHTTSTEQGLAELHRVLKPGGQAWLYLYGGKESFFWDVVDTCRDLLDGIPQAYAQTVMRGLGYAPGRIFHRVDFWYVPLHRRYFQAEVESMTAEAGFREARRLERGVAHDWDEIRHANPAMDDYIYGEGEMRFWLTK